MVTRGIHFVSPHQFTTSGTSITKERSSAQHSRIPQGSIQLHNCRWLDRTSWRPQSGGWGAVMALVMPTALPAAAAPLAMEVEAERGEWESAWPHRLQPRSHRCSVVPRCLRGLPDWEEGKEREEGRQKDHYFHEVFSTNLRETTKQKFIAES